MNQIHWKKKNDPRFSKAAEVIVFNLNPNDFKYLDNGLSQTRSQGASIKTASTLLDKGVNTVITDFVGPKVYKVLKIIKCKNNAGSF